MPTLLTYLKKYLPWLAISLLGAFAFAVLALSRGESISAIWILLAAICSYLVAYRFYSRIITQRIFQVDDTRATPAEIHNDGKDYIPTNKWIVFGHHFAAIAGPGPLVGPILAAQMGYLPGALWIIIGVVLGGAVQDCVILLASLRRDGKSLGEIAREEIGWFGGILASLAILSIVIILMAVVALVVVKALAESPWGFFTVLMTLPVAMLMGLYLRYFRPGRVLEISLVGFGLLLLSLWGGQWISVHPVYAQWFTFEAPELALMIAGYGFIASVLPVWFLLAPRDYLSAFLKIGVVFLLGIGIVVVMPDLKMPGVTKFIDGSGPVFSGPLFPFLFITIACGAISGFHALVASGTTPKMLRKESDARMIGFGGMLMESLVAIMALIAACALDPGLYFAMNAPLSALGDNVVSAAKAISQWGFVITPEYIAQAARDIGEATILSRTGGAPTLALGMADILAQFLAGAKAFWYHFAILFEAVFILTTVDAGTRIGRFICQDFMGNIYKPFADTTRWQYNIIASFIIAFSWGYILYQGAIDPFGGVNSLWSMLGISNQMLAAMALAIGTTVIIKRGKARYAWITLIPFVWLTVTTFTAGLMKLFSSDPRLGFLAHARWLESAMAQDVVMAPAKNFAMMEQIILNNKINAGITGFLVIMVALVVGNALWVWYQLLIQKKPYVSFERPYVQSKLI